ncbi:hypothetical protein EVAR_4212_1 [Eumeta japonica]|uniref:Uncharacterized protein n=1 Tax=Eumeta variegata TaxID=151549 RepID=A0A4C1TJ82_EUMVA|nr:hypothetical protein EVAR_4212_1 [Eumeta japonica]
MKARCLSDFERFNQRLNFAERDGRQIVFGFEEGFVLDLFLDAVNSAISASSKTIELSDLLREGTGMYPSYLSAW